jgi:hypothetical protein
VPRVVWRGSCGAGRVALALASRAPWSYLAAGSTGISGAAAFATAAR